MQAMRRFSIAQLLQEMQNKLLQNPDLKDDALHRAWWMLEEITMKNRSELLSLDFIELTKDSEKTLAWWISEQVEYSKPLAYLIGWVPFGNIRLSIEPPILIPRPETEEWVHNLITNLTTLKDQNIHILDLCTGSGCIALALAHALPNAHITAVDVSPVAIELTKENIGHNKIKNVTCMQSDLFESLPKNTKYDIIVSNPPYISRQEYASLDKSVREWEDPLALVAEDSGLAIIKKIIVNSKKYLKENKELQEKNIAPLYIEIGYQQGAAVLQFMKKTGYSNTAITKDLFGNDRLASGFFNL